MTEADRFSLEALQHIHREMDDDQDGGIEVEESVEVISVHRCSQEHNHKPEVSSHPNVNPAGFPHLLANEVS